MTYEEAEARIHALTRFGSQKGLGRMGRLMALLDNPQERLLFVHVAGTNGKGTTSRLIASVLERAGFRTGLFISPFVVEFRERYQINGSMIPREDFTVLMEELLPRLRQLSEAGDEVTEFEAVTALGFLWFARQRCDVVVLEVGLGGRFDATNIIPPPLCGVITSISMDHTAILGDTLEQIAFEKAGIIKQDMDVVTYPLQPPEVLGVFYERCARTGSRLIQPSLGSLEIREETAFGSEFVYRGERCRLPFPGRHQIGNALDAIEALQVLRRKGLAISREQLREGLEAARLPARFEVLSRSPLVILDGAHNLQAAQGLADTLALVDASPKVAVMGMMRDKDCQSVLEIIGSRCEQLIAVPVLDVPRALPPEEFAALARPWFSHTEAWTDQPSALKRAAELAGPSGAVVLCGSFYLASQLRPLAPRICSPAVSEERLWQEEDLFPMRIASREEREYGCLFYDLENKNSYDSNHALLRESQIDDLGTVLEDVRRFYQERGIRPNVYESAGDEGYFRRERETFHKHGFRIWTELQRYMVLSEESVILPSTEIEVRRAKRWEESWSEIFREEPWELLPARRTLEREGGWLLIAFRGETPAGMLSGHVNREGLCRIDYLLTAKAHRRRGVGRALVQQLINERSSLGIAECYLWPSGETAEHIYHEAGFRLFFSRSSGRACFGGGRNCIHNLRDDQECP